jgi:hypothetical protein
MDGKSGQVLGAEYIIWKYQDLNENTWTSSRAAIKIYSKLYMVLYVALS